jgi:hypothetical protein
MDTLTAQGRSVSTLDIPLKFLCKTNERKTKRKCVMKGRKAKFVSERRERIIHGSIVLAVVRLR